MSKVTFKLNRDGVRDTLKSEAAQEECGKYARQMYSAISGIPGYEIEKRNYQERAGYALLAKDYPAISDNQNNNTLLKVGKV